MTIREMWEIPQDRLNAYVREDTGCPDIEDKVWKIWRITPNGAVWYIPEDDECPADDNIIEGETGELYYLDREDAEEQWGEGDEEMEES